MPLSSREQSFEVNRANFRKLRDSAVNSAMECSESSDCVIASWLRLALNYSSEIETINNALFTVKRSDELSLTFEK